MSKILSSGNQKQLLRRRTFLGGVTAVGVGALVACSSGGTASSGGGSTPASGSSSGGAAAQSATVQMTDQNQYNPATVTIAKGGTVTWNNTSSTQHSATCDPSKAVNKSDASLPSGAQPFDSGLVDPGKSFSQTFSVAGTYKYFCIPHETLGMLGTINVQ
jgi:plastocyanin